MRSFVFFGRKLDGFSSNSSRTKTSCLSNHISHQGLISSFFHFLVFKLNPLWVQLAYFLVLSLVGYGLLSISTPKSHSLRPNNFDIFFTSVSSATVSSMSTVEMEVFSNTQLLIMTVLMLAGGEVFTSMLGLQLERSKFRRQQSPPKRVNSLSNITHQIELGNVTISNSTLENNQKPVDSTDSEKNDSDINSSSNTTDSLEYRALKYLGYVVLGYLLVVHIVGSSLVSMYVSLVSSARNVLKTKGIEMQTFTIFTVVSTFTNCGFVPTNENMIVFNKNSGLLLLLIPQILLGNTLYPVCLRALLWLLEKTTKRVEISHILKNYEEMEYGHLLSGVHCCFLSATVLGFVLVQFVVFCSMEWGSEAMDGLSWYQKLVGSLFQVVNSRHTGESIVDLSTVSSAILVLFVVMMYLPPYTSLLPTKYQKKDSAAKDKVNQNQGRSILECILFSQLSYLAIFIILVCISERDKIKEDPLNFNVLNITIEVISAYGNVGFTTGYSCKRQLKPDSSCRDSWAGFVGRWSNMGKFILIVVMIFGRLKKFNMKGGKAWKLS